MRPLGREQRARTGRRLSLLALLVLTLLTVGPAGRSAASDPPGLPATEQVKVLDADAVLLGAGSSLVPHPTDPQKLYWSILDLGILKSLDGGVTWAPKNHGLPDPAITALAMDP